MTGQDVKRQEDLIDAARERNFAADLRARGYVVLTEEEAAPARGVLDSAAHVLAELFDGDEDVADSWRFALDGIIALLTPEQETLQDKLDAQETKRHQEQHLVSTPEQNDG